MPGLRLRASCTRLRVWAGSWKVMASVAACSSLIVASTEASEVSPATASRPCWRAALTSSRSCSRITGFRPCALSCSDTRRPTLPQPAMTMCCCSGSAAPAGSSGNWVSASSGAACRPAVFCAGAGLSHRVKGAKAANSKVLPAIETIAPASTRLWPASGSSLSDTARLARMKLNSPIWPSVMPTSKAEAIDRPDMRITTAAHIALPNMMMAATTSSLSGSRHSTWGSNSMPTETKNSTANASRSGSDSSAARWLYSDSRIIMPAKNAPSANDTSNSAAAPNAVPMAMVSTHNVNNSLEPVLATHHSTCGNRRRPTSNISATKATTLPRVSDRLSASAPSDGALPAPPAGSNIAASAGTSTSTSTITMSSTTSQPTMMRPFWALSSPRASKALSATTVLATDRHKPNSTDSGYVQPQAWPATVPISVATVICTSAPGTAMRRTCIRSPIEKCMPTPNISSITPISASCPARPTSPTNPGVNGPMQTPASK